MTDSQSTLQQEQNNSTTTQVQVQAWDSTRYGGDNDHPQTFVMEVDDQRQGGRLYLGIGAEDAPDDDILGCAAEVACLPGSKTPVQCFHIQVGDEVVLSIFKQDDKLILRPATAEATLLRTVLTDKAPAWILEAQQ